ncbi:MAG: HepT-like ribonuclease domain-containing protein [Rhizomicrobium sp.]|jgi:uncharacterized protein with HEPN domain
MPSERTVRCFTDIIAAIDLVQSWVAGGAEQTLRDNVLVRSAVERQILVISEAAVRLEKIEPGLSAKVAPEIDWAGIRGIGNFIRHKYDDLDATVISDVVSNRLQSLRSAAERGLAQQD